MVKRLIYILLIVFTAILNCSDLHGMPRRIQFSAGHTTEYVYDADGRKLRTVHRTAVPNMSVPLNSTVELDATNTLGKDSTDYVGSFILRQGQLDKYLFDGGYVTFSGATPQFHYYGKDHLGNNRTVVNSNGTVEQVTHYYPFGGLMGESTNGDIQRYKYNGKELDRMNGLDWYDYGARHMDGIRFTTIDPMAEKYYGVSPYVYCKDNPVKYVDPDGKKVRIYKKNQKQVLRYINKLAQGTFAVNKSGYLFLAKPSNSDGFSKTYTESLVRAIENKEKTINIYVDNYYFDKDGNKQDISQKGEGATKEYLDGTISVVISGESYNGLVDKDNNSISDDPEYILAHEIAGHAEPRLNDKGDGKTVNAVEVENIIRKETNAKERREEPNHVQ